MQSFFSILGHGATAFAIYGILVLTYTLLGAWNNINVWQQTWDWRKWINGGVKYFVLGAIGLVIMACAYLLVAELPAWGVSINNLEAVSVKVIYGVIAAAIVAMLLKNIQKLAEILSVSDKTVKKAQAAAIAAEGNEPLQLDLEILDVGDLPESQPVDNDPTATDGVLEEIKKARESGTDSGRGAYVTTASPDAFRNAVIDRLFDVDGYYGAQCWDGGALFWLNAVGRSLSTGGTGAARGCWEVARSVNAGSEFELVTNANDIRKGDWLFFGGTQWGHVGMAMSGNLGGYIKLLGENQGGRYTMPQGGSSFNEVNFTLNNFLGGMRLKKWSGATNKPSKPVSGGGTYTVRAGDTMSGIAAKYGISLSQLAGLNPQIANLGQIEVGQKIKVPKSGGGGGKTNKQLAREVMAGKWGNGEDRKRRLTAAGYNYAAVQAEVDKLVNTPAKEPERYEVVRPGEGLSAIAKRAGFSDYAKSGRWAAISKLNGVSDWRAFNKSLKPGQLIRVK